MRTAALRTHVTLLAALLCLLVALPAAAQAPRAYAVVGAKVYTLAGPPLENATVVIRDGKITAVGRDAAVPSGAKVIEAKGLEIYPGMFDPVTDLGLTEVGAVSATVDTDELGQFNPDVVAATAVHPASTLIPVARANGITHALAVPGIRAGFPDIGGGASLIGGQASLINLSGWVIDDMLVRKSAAMVLNWPGLRTRTFDFSTFSVRNRPWDEVKKEYDKKIEELADYVERSRHYAQAVAKGSSANYERDLKLEAMIPVVEGKLPLLVAANSARAIRDSVEFCEKHRLKMILAGGAEAYKVADLLKKDNIPVVLQPTQSLPEEEDEPYDQPYSTPGELSKAGVKIAFASFSGSASRRLPYEAGTAVAFGLPHDEALKAVTLYPAQIFGVAGELGTIEPGKLANLIVTTGDPLEIQTQVRYLFIDGQLTSLENKHLDLYEKYRKRP